MPRNPDRSEQMRAQSQAALLQSTRTLFAEQGYFQTKVSEVARAADMSQGNVYWYFSSKEELLRAVLSEGFDTMGLMLEAAAALTLPSLEKLEALIQAQINFSKEGSEFMTILLSPLSHGGVPFAEVAGL